MTPLTNKWQIRKSPLWPYYPLPWQIVPPRNRFNSCELNITCFPTGADAIAAFNRGRKT